MDKNKLVANVTVDVIGLDKIKTLIELLDQYQERLPEKLKEQLKVVADNEHFEFDVEWFRSRGIQVHSIVIDGEVTSHVISINKILKRAKVHFGREVLYKKVEVFDVHGNLVFDDD